MKKQYCMMSYHRSTVSELDTFSNGVENGVYSNITIFLEPPFNQAAFAANKDSFAIAAAEYATYGNTKKVAFQEARETLINTLDALAAFVDETASGNESIILLAGFVPSSASLQNNLPLEKINYFVLKRTENSGEVVVEIPAISGYGNINYHCICIESKELENHYITNGQLKLDTKDNNVVLDSNKSRRKIFTRLTPGTNYYFYVYATNTVSVSSLSDAKTLMAT